MNKFTIVRSKWNRGDKNPTHLSNEHGMCCLGFFACALGAEQDDLYRKCEPADAAEVVTWPEWMLEKDEDFGGVRHSEECWDLMHTNDDAKLPEEKRESAIADTFAGHGITVEFVD